MAVGTKDILTAFLYLQALSIYFFERLSLMTREIVFWCIASVMMLAAVASVLVALWRPQWFVRGKEAAVDANRTILADQLKELHAMHEKGELTDATYAESVAELERRVLEEGVAHVPGKKTNIPFLIAAPACAVVIVASAVGVYLHLGSPVLINFTGGASEGLMQPDGTVAENTNETNPEQMKAYLASNPKDDRAWVLYARLMAQSESWPEASEAYAKALALGKKTSKDPQVKTEYAATLMGMKRPGLYEQALKVLDESLAMDETSLEAHELYAIASMELMHWTAAREHIEFIMSRLSRDDPSYRNAAEAAAYAGKMEREEEARSKKAQGK